MSKYVRSIPPYLAKANICLILLLSLVLTIMAIYASYNYQNIFLILFFWKKNVKSYCKSFLVFSSLTPQLYTAHTNMHANGKVIFPSKHFEDRYKQNITLNIFSCIFVINLRKNRTRTQIFWNSPPGLHRLDALLDCWFSHTVRWASFGKSLKNFRMLCWQCPFDGVCCSNFAVLFTQYHHWFFVN